LTLVLAGCDGGSDGADDIGNDPPLFNISGRFVDGGSQRCVDQFGDTLPVPPSDVLITQNGSALTLVIERSGHRHHGRVAGDSFYLASTIDAVGETCDYDFSGTIFSNDHFAGVENIECSDGSSAVCPGSVLKRKVSSN
jgi:hypothetical protein